MPLTLEQRQQLIDVVYSSLSDPFALLKLEEDQVVDMLRKDLSGEIRAMQMRLESDEILGMAHEIYDLIASLRPTRTQT